MAPAADQAWRELCGGDVDGDETEAGQTAYGSLLGPIGRKPAKRPVLELDPETAERAAHLLEINAGRFFVDPGKTAADFPDVELDAGTEGESASELTASEAPEGGRRANAAEWIVPRASDAPTGGEAPAEQAWPEWARFIAETPTGDEEPEQEEPEQVATPTDVAALTEEIATALPEPELPKHRTRAHLAKLPAPRHSPARPRRTGLRRLVLWLRRLFA